MNSDPAWLAYVTGVVGMLTGIAGMVTALATYRRVSHMKTLELRLELKRVENETRTVLGQLPALIGQAQGSRTSVLVAAGGLGSSAQVAWHQGFERDRVDVDALVKALPAPGDDYRALGADELESRLAAIDALRTRAARIRDKCYGTIAEDEKSREQLQPTQWIKRP